MQENTTWAYVSQDLKFWWGGIFYSIFISLSAQTPQCEFTNPTFPFIRLSNHDPISIFPTRVVSLDSNQQWQLPIACCGHDKFKKKLRNADLKAYHRRILPRRIWWCWKGVTVERLAWGTWPFAVSKQTCHSWPGCSQEDNGQQHTCKTYKQFSNHTHQIGRSSIWRQIFTEPSYRNENFP